MESQANGTSGRLARVCGLFLSIGFWNSCGPKGSADERRQQRGSRQVEPWAGAEYIIGRFGRKLAECGINCFMRQLTEGQRVLSQRSGRG
jgi:hypothetical protein